MTRRVTPQHPPRFVSNNSSVTSLKPLVFAAGPSMGSSFLSILATGTCWQGHPFLSQDAVSKYWFRKRLGTSKVMKVIMILLLKHSKCSKEFSQAIGILGFLVAPNSFPSFFASSPKKRDNYPFSHNHGNQTERWSIYQCPLCLTCHFHSTMIFQEHQGQESGQK